jgi:hypothetical protein
MFCLAVLRLRAREMLALYLQRFVIYMCPLRQV